MKKPIIIFLLSFLLCSCSSAFFRKTNPTQTSGIDFSQGKWLLGDIEVDAYLKDELTELALKDFSVHLKDRLKYSLKEHSLLLPPKIPLNPSKSAIADLKKGTGYDYYINIKSQDKRNDLSDFDFTQHNYYKMQMTYGVVIIEVYDLNQGEIIYRQGVFGSVNEDIGLNINPKRKVVIGSYKKIINEINSH